MELNQQVWLRKESSHWGWVPAVIVKKEEICDAEAGLDYINLWLVNDRSIEGTPYASSASPSHRSSSSNRKTLIKSGSQYFADEEDFTEVIQVDKEQLKLADHDDIKLRNLPNSFQLSGTDPEAGVITSPSSIMNRGVVGGVDDLIELTHLHEPAILHALRLRYDSDIIYTATGPILIAVNPFKPMQHLYSEEMMEQYRLQGNSKSSARNNNNGRTPMKGGSTPSSSKASSTLPPHVYQTADHAYHQMMRGIENKRLISSNKASATTPTNQSILVSGESGAGKTVTTKIVLNYFAMLSRKRQQETTERSTPSKTPQMTPQRVEQDAVEHEQQVLQSNPILESFGNARTIRNDNSSRFGKYIDISFTKSGKLSGASIETYLLEKVRLIHPSLGERNYHVFYQFLKAATAKERQEFFIGNKVVEDFRLLTESGTFGRRDGVNDEDCHLEMLNAMVRTLYILV